MASKPAKGECGKKGNGIQRLHTELDYFNQEEPKLATRYLGQYVAVHDHAILCYGKDPDEVVNNLLKNYRTPPDPLLIRQVRAAQRQPLRMRSPKLPSRHVR